MADLTQTQGSLTIVDFNDAPMLQASIEVDTGSPTQVYKTDSSSYSAGDDWSVNNLKLIPQLFKSGSSPIEVCSDAGSLVEVEWYHNFDGSWHLILDTDVGYSLANLGRDSMTISSNVLGIVTRQGQIKSEIKYTDNLTGLSTIGVSILNVNVIGTQTGSVALILTPDRGLTFKNGATANNNPITLTADLMRGSAIDDSDLTITWFQDGDEKQSLTSPAVGWNTYEVTAADVFSKAVISCTAYDSALDDTYTNSVQIIDVTDPIQVEVSSDIGNIFKVGEANLAKLTAKMYQNGYPIDALPAGIGYIWVLLNSVGNPRPWSSGGGAADVVISGTGIAGNNFVTLANTTNIYTGYDISGTGIPLNTKINRIDGLKVYLTEKLTANGSLYTFGLDDHEKYTSVDYLNITDADISVRGTIVAKVFF